MFKKYLLKKYALKWYFLLPYDKFFKRFVRKIPKYSHKTLNF